MDGARVRRMHSEQAILYAPLSPASIQVQAVGATRCRHWSAELAAAQSAVALVLSEQGQKAEHSIRRLAQ